MKVWKEKHKLSERKLELASRELGDLKGDVDLDSFEEGMTKEKAEKQKDDKKKAS